MRGLILAPFRRDPVGSNPGDARQGDEAGPLFVTEQGAPLTMKYLSAMVTRYVRQAGFAKAGSCHLFRHTCATLMREHGADIRHVQEQLGHACLQTTQVYTHGSIRRLKEVHAATHPGATLSAEARAELEAELDAEEAELADAEGGA